jgi:hypothetical protein
MPRCGLADSQRRSGTLCKKSDCEGCRPYRAGKVRVVHAATKQAPAGTASELADSKAQVAAAQEEAAHWLGRAADLDAKYTRLCDVCRPLIALWQSGSGLTGPHGDALFEQLRATVE